MKNLHVVCKVRSKTGPVHPMLKTVIQNSGLKNTEVYPLLCIQLKCSNKILESTIVKKISLLLIVSQRTLGKYSDTINYNQLASAR